MLSRRRLMGIGVAGGLASAFPAFAQTNRRPIMETTNGTANDVITLVNIFTPEPGNLDELVGALKEGTETFFSTMPGFVSSSVLVARDGKQAVNYSQWRTEADIAGFRQDPRFQPYLQRLLALAKAQSLACDVAYVRRAGEKGVGPMTLQATNEAATRRWVLILTSTASLMVALDALVVSTALGAIGREFDASIEALEWTVNAYMLSFAVLLLTGSALGDRYGRRLVFGMGQALFVLASAGCALAPGIGALIAARCLQGAGAAMMMPLALAQLGAAFPPERRGWALGIYSGVTALSTVIGPVLGGVITQSAAWQWIFWLNLPIGVPAIVLTFTRLRESFGPRERLDIGGLVLATAAAFGLVWGLVRANAVGWTRPEILVSLGGGLLLALAFVVWERRAAVPMMPMRLFGRPAFAACNAAMFLLNGALISAIFFMAQFQEAALGQSALAAGLRLLPWGVAVTLVAPKAGAPRGADRRQVGDRPRPGLAGGGPRLARDDRAAGPGLRPYDPSDDRRRSGLCGRGAHHPEMRARCGGVAGHRQGLGHARHHSPARRRVRRRRHRRRLRPLREPRSRASLLRRLCGGDRRSRRSCLSRAPPRGSGCPEDRALRRRRCLRRLRPQMAREGRSA